MLDKRLIILLTYLFCSTLSLEDEDKPDCSCDTTTEEVCSNDMKTYLGECEMKCANPDATVLFNTSCENAVRFMLAPDHELNDDSSKSNLTSTLNLSSTDDITSAEPDLTTSVPDATSTEATLDLPTSTQTQLDVLTTEPTSTVSLTGNSTSDPTVCDSDLRIDTGECLNETTDPMLNNDYPTILIDQDRSDTPEPFETSALTPSTSSRRNMQSLTSWSHSFLPPSQLLLPDNPTESSVNQHFPQIPIAPANNVYPSYPSPPPSPMYPSFYNAPPPIPNSASFYPASPLTPSSTSFDPALPPSSNHFYSSAPSASVTSSTFANSSPQRFPILSFAHNPRPRQMNPSARRKRYITRSKMHYATPNRRPRQTYFELPYSPGLVMKPIEYSRSSTYDEKTGNSRSAAVTHSAGSGPNTFVMRRSYSSKSVPTVTKAIMPHSRTFTNNQKTGYHRSSDDKPSDWAIAKETRLLEEALKDIVKFHVKIGNKNVNSTNAHHNSQVKV